MKVLILFAADSPQDREAEDFSKHLLELQVESETLAADSPEGTQARELYDLTGTPAVVVTRDDGTLVERFQNSWPLAEDISYLYHN